MKINLVMIVKNEERTLERCLKAAKPLVDAIIIADTGSTDRTVEIARQMGAAVYPFTWVNDFSAARNFALEKSDGDWNLVLDADETVRWGCMGAAPDTAPNADFGYKKLPDPWDKTGHDLMPVGEHGAAERVREALERRKELERLLADGERIGRGTWIGGITRYDSYRDEEGISVSTSVLPRLLPRGVRYTGAIHEQPIGPAGDYPCYAVPLEADHDGYLYADKGERNLPYLEQAVADHPDDGYYHFQLASTLRNLKRLEESLAPFREFYRLTGPGEGRGPEGHEVDGHRPNGHGDKSGGCRGAGQGKAGKEGFGQGGVGKGGSGQGEVGYRAGGIVLYLYTLLDIGTPSCLDEAGTIIDWEMDALGDWSDFCFVCGLFYMKRVLSDVQRYISLLPNIEKCYLRCLKLGEHPEDGGVVGTGSFKAAYNLGAWYEVSGQTELAVQYYRMAAEEGYEKAVERLRELGVR